MPETVGTTSPGARPRLLAWTVVVLLELFLLGLGAGMMSDARQGAFTAGRTRTLEQLKDQARQAPDNVALQTRVRELDLRLRQQEIARQKRFDLGAVLLVAAAAAFIAALHGALHHPRHIPAVVTASSFAQTAQPHDHGRGAAHGAVLAMGLLLVGLAVPWLGRTEPWLSAAAPMEAPLATILPPPSLSVMRENWPRFRGADGQGVASWSDIPATFDPATGANVRWKVPLPLPGRSSPVVWGQRVFVTAASRTQRLLIALDADRGAVLWQREVNVPGPAPTGEAYEDTGYAAPTPVTDGQVVAALFTYGELACFDLEGKPLWSKRLDVSGNTYGHASSLVLWRDRLLVQLDRGEADEKHSALLALDRLTGRLLWEARRPVGASWATPIIVGIAGREEIVTVAKPLALAHDPQTGDELWRAEVSGGEVVSSPVLTDGPEPRLIFIHPGSEVVALRLGGQGDITATHVLWRGGEVIPDITSPVAAQGLVFTLSSGGTLSCLDAGDGKVLWTHEYETPCRASPSVAGDRLYVTTQDGVFHALRVGRVFAELGKSALGETCEASPAFMPGRMYVRGAQHLWCIAAPAQRKWDR